MNGPNHAADGGSGPSADYRLQFTEKGMIQPHPAISVGDMKVWLSRLACSVFLLALYPYGLAAFAEVIVRATGGVKVLDGESPHLVVTGLQPGEQATVHAFRRTMLYPTATSPALPVLAHAEAVFGADGSGRITVDSAVPLRGTYEGADGLGLLWSGTRLDVAGSDDEPITQALNIRNEQEIVVRVEARSLGKAHWAETRLMLTDGAETLEVLNVAQPGLNGVFARPKAPSAGTLPAIILLHGSEGGSTGGARATAIRFAQLGYAAFALNYFAWPAAGLQGIPQALIDVPVEEIATTRAWLSQQSGVDARQVAVWGVSKGAELALVAASHYDWIDRAVACVPSSVVWSGFGRPPAPGEVYSSWSIAGVGLPYIPYDHYEDALNRKFSAAFVHQRSLDKASEEQRRAARIPVEKTRARLLLLAGSKDVVWPSAAMTADIEATLRAAHLDAIAKAYIFPDASHYICGTGSEPRRINPVLKPEGDNPTPEADAHAAAVGWQQTKLFLQTSRSHGSH